MEKHIADKLIFEYKDKVFGFALDKLHSIDRAQELASDIIFEVYRSFLRRDDIANPDGYVYRIARNVWAQYVHRLETGRRFDDISDMEIAAPEDTSSDEEEMQELLKREIGYLSERQRLVIYMHYYNKLPVAEIAGKLGISAGTVKWHLSDARTKLKEGINMNFDKNLEINPIHFESCGHSGYTGSRGDTKDLFDTMLKQNIAWACYNEPKTLEEIARAVGVPQIYAASELEPLVDFGFIDKLDNSKNPKYRTNVYIGDLRDRQSEEELRVILNDAAEVLADKYFPKVFADFDADPAHFGLSCDGDDTNYLKYDLVMLALRKLREDINYDEFSKYMVERPDGGRFIAYATITDSATQIPKDEYWSCGDMTRDNVNGSSESDSVSLQVDCRYADRQGNWRDNLDSDWDSLLTFIRKGKENLTPEQYKRLVDKGYLYEDRVQPVIVRVPENELSGILGTHLNGWITVPDEIKAFCKEVDAKCYAHNIKAHPGHMHGLVKVWNQNVLGAMIMLPRVIEKLLDKGMLKPLTDVQKKSVFSVMYIAE